MVVNYKNYQCRFEEKGLLLAVVSQFTMALFVVL